MNERIKELEKEAIACLKHKPFSTVQFHEKFAELIVQDILTVVKSEHKLALEFQWDADDTAIAIRDAIKKRFGVAE
jgi:hypothetical protein